MEIAKKDKDFDERVKLRNTFLIINEEIHFDETPRNTIAIILPDDFIVSDELQCSLLKVIKEDIERLNG